MRNNYYTTPGKKLSYTINNTPSNISGRNSGMGNSKDNSLNISNTKTAVDSHNKRRPSRVFNTVSKSNKFRSSVDYTNA